MTAGHVAIVGGGYSGLLQALNLLRYGDARVTLIERAERVGRGAAYSTPHADHLLNVRAGRMSAFADAPDHFAEWLRRRGEGDAASFAQRRVYGGYLEDLLETAVAEAGDRLRIVKGEAVAVVREGDREVVGLAGGGTVEADAVILSIGNLPPETPRGIRPSELPSGVYVADPWAGDIAAGLSAGDEVLLIGTGLTAIDAALILDAADFQGRITAISRRGMVPRAHEGDQPVLDHIELSRGRLSKLVRSVREQAQSIGWRPAVDRLRPHTQKLWATSSVEERRRFLRHLRPYWDVHRHRIAPEIAERIATMEREGRLRFRAGKLLSVDGEGKGARMAWRPRGSETAETFAARRIVNCTGPQGDVTRAGEPLLASLVAAGRIRPDPCRIGIDIDEDSRVLGTDGQPSASLYAIGPMTRGAWWEIVAVPDLRGQVDALARTLSVRS